MQCTLSVRKHVRIVARSLMAVALLFGALQATSSSVRAEDKRYNKAEKALRRGEFEQAEKLYRVLLEKDASDNRARLGLSYTLLKRRNLLDAYDHAARVIANDPLSGRGHALLGASLLATGEFRIAVEEFRTSLSLNVDESLAIAGLAMVDFYDGRSMMSLAGLRRAVDLDPNEPDYLFSLAQAAARSERYREAADAYERFLVIAPNTDIDRRDRIRGLISFLRYLGSQNGLYTPTGANRVSVPFEAEDNRPTIIIHVNGRKEALRFVLDTGSGMSVLSEETAKHLGIRPVARGGLSRAVGGNGKFELVYGFLESVDIGETRVQNVPIYIRRFFDMRTKVDGYIGLGLIAKYELTVDYGTRVLSLVKQGGNETDAVAQSDILKTSAPNSGVIDIPIRTSSSGFLSGEVKLDGISKTLNFIIDTGASISVVSESLATSEDLSRFEQSTKMRVYGAAGIAENVKMLMLPSLMFGNHARNQISAAVLDLDMINETSGFNQNGILGGNFLRHFRLTFNFQRAFLRLEPLIANVAQPDKLPLMGEMGGQR